eukprot:13104208-Alexandrium_andersonii.AAC.2
MGAPSSMFASCEGHSSSSASGSASRLAPPAVLAGRLLFLWALPSAVLLLFLGVLYVSIVALPAARVGGSRPAAFRAACRGIGLVTSPPAGSPRLSCAPQLALCTRSAAPRRRVGQVAQARGGAPPRSRGALGGGRAASLPLSSGAAPAAGVALLRQVGAACGCAAP